MDDHNTEDCCRELTRVWDALGITYYTGKSASQEVSILKNQLAEAREKLAASIAAIGPEPGEGGTR